MKRAALALLLPLVLALSLALPTRATAEHIPAEALRTGNITVRFDAADRAAAARVLAAAPDTLARVALLTGDADDHLDIRIAPSARAMRALVPPDLAPPAWASGVAYPERGLILLTLRDPNGAAADLDDVLRHEIAHVSLHRATGGRPLPRWFHEGVAHLGEGFSWGHTFTLMDAALHGRIIPLAELDEHFPARENPVAIAYAQSYDFVDYLVEKHGTVALRGLVMRVGRGMPFQTALREVYADGLDGLEEGWVAELRLRYLWLPMVTTGLLLWAVGAVLLFFGWRRRRRQNRARLLVWAAEEAARDAARDARIAARQARADSAASVSSSASA